MPIRSHFSSDIPTPPGYTRIPWRVVLPSDVVYLVGTCNGTPCAYGPHSVVDVDTRQLRNPLGQVFMHLAEDLLVTKE